MLKGLPKRPIICPFCGSRDVVLEIGPYIYYYDSTNYPSSTEVK